MNRALGEIMKDIFLKQKKEDISKKLHPMSSWGASPLPFLIMEAVKTKDFGKVIMANNMFLQDTPAMMGAFWKQIKRLRGEK